MRALSFITLTLAALIVVLAFACGETLTVSPNDGVDAGASSADGNAQLQPSDGGLPEDSGDGSAPPIKFECGFEEALCTTFEEQNTLAKWGSPLGRSTLVESLSVSPTHSLQTIAAVGEVSTLNKDFAKELFGNEPRKLEAEFEFYLDSPSEGVGARIATLVLSKKDVGIAGDAVYRILAVRRPDPAGFEMRIHLGNNSIGALSDAPNKKWSKLRLTAMEKVGGSEWEVTAEYGSGMDTRSVPVGSPGETKFYSLEIGSDRGGLDAGGEGTGFTAYFDNVRVRKL